MAELSIDDNYSDEYNIDNCTEEEYDLLCKKKHDILLSEFEGTPEEFEKFWNGIERKWQATLLTKADFDEALQEIKDGKVMSSEEFWRDIDEEFGLFDIL
jgi:hypothetical protein